MALGSLGSAFTASASHSPNSANGSSAAVKSPDVNTAGCLMQVVSVIRSSELRPPAAQSALQPLYKTWQRFGLSAIGPAGVMLTLFIIGMGSGGCSLSRPEGGFAKMDDPE